MNKSPLRYPGGKTRACKTLASIFKLHFLDKLPHKEQAFDCIYSPFFGGGSFELYLQSVMQNNWEYKTTQKDAIACGCKHKLPKVRNLQIPLHGSSHNNEEVPNQVKVLANDKFTPLYNF